MLCDKKINKFGFHKNGAGIGENPYQVRYGCLLIFRCVPCGITLSVCICCCFSAVYLAVTLCLGVVCCLLTVLVIKIYFKGPNNHVTPKWRLLHDKVLAPFSCWTGCPCQCGREKTEECSNELKWTHLARVMDHFFLVVMFVITTISSITFMVALAAGGELNE